MRFADFLVSLGNVTVFFSPGTRFLMLNLGGEASILGGSCFLRMYVCRRILMKGRILFRTAQDGGVGLVPNPRDSTES